MVERQKIKPERPRVVDLIFCVITFDPNRARPLSEIHVQTTTYGNNIRSVSLKNISIDIGPWFVKRISLQRIRRLPKLQIKTAAQTPPIRCIRRMIEYHTGLIQAEAVTQNVVSAQQINSSDGRVEVVLVISIQPNVDG